MNFHSFIGAAFALCGSCAAVAQGTTVVTIGHVGPMSGGQAHYGKDTRNAASMAIEDLNARQIVIGGKRVEFRLQVEDDAADPRQGTAAAQKFCDEKVAGVVGHINSGTAIPASKVYESCGIPFISPGSTNPRLTQLGYATTFRVLATDNALAAGVAKYAAAQLKMKRVAVVDDRTAYGQGVASTFKLAAKANGLDIVAEEFTTDKATDFSAILASVKAKRPEAIFYGGSDGQAGPMLRQMTQLGMGDVRMLGGDGICTPQLVDLAAKSPAVEKVICAEGGSSLAKMPGGEAWKARYDKKFPGEYVLFSPYAYDGVQVIAEAMRQANSTDPKRYLPVLKAIHFKGVTTEIVFDEYGDLRDAAISLYSFKGAKKTLID